ncbi:MAG: tetratricopeptide repeat protein, partial [Candidatus Riflebacteria bacterium]|nr:tetratricopeptide repeat protein [Candidatus Riflebacteria bacterium]
MQQEGESQSWFAGFTEMLKGWFFSEPKSNSVNKPKIRPRVKTPRLSTNPNELTDVLPLTPSQLFLKSARKNLYRNFAIADAMEDLKQSYEIDSANVDTLFLIAFALLTASDNAKIKHYVDTTEKLLDPNDEYALSKFNLIKTVFINRDYEEGLSQAKRLHSIYPDDYDIFFMIFFCYETLGDYKEAIAVSYEIQKLGKKNNIVAVAQSECYFSIMDFDNAIKVLQDRIAEFPRLYNLQVKVFQALMLSGRYKEAQSKTGDIIKKDPNNMLMHVNHARAQIFNDDIKGAFNTMRKVVGMPGDDMLRAISYCCLYKLAVMLGKENPERYLQQAKALRPGIYFPTNAELVKNIESEQMKGIDEELGHPIWFPAVRYYAHRICADTMAPKSFTIGNFGCTSFFVIGENGEYTHNNIFSNFNVY